MEDLSNSKQRGLGASEPYARIGVDQLLEPPEIAFRNLARNRVEDGRGDRRRGKAPGASGFKLVSNWDSLAEMGFDYGGQLLLVHRFDQEVTATAGITLLHERVFTPHG